MRNTRRSALRSGVGRPVEALEGRVMLSSYPSRVPDQAGAVLVSWGGVEALARPDEYLIRLDGLAGSRADQVAAAEGRLGASGVAARVDEQLGLDGLFRVSAAPGTPPEAVSSAMSKVGGLRYVEPNYILSGQGEPVFPDDPLFPLLYGLHNTGQTIQGTPGVPGADVDAPEAWGITTGSRSVVVGVIDSGIDYRHPDLYRNIFINQGEIPAGLRSALVDVDGDGLITFHDLNHPSNSAFASDRNGTGFIDAGDLLADPRWADGRDTDGNGFVDDLFGWNFFNNTNNPIDENGHGTHVAGTIGARGNNGVGVVGVSWDVQLVPLRFLGAGNTGPTSAAIAAVNYATMMRQRGANLRVTNNSWGGGAPNRALRDAIAAGAEADILFVAAAGNSNNNNDASPFFPAAYPLDNVVAVAATTNRDLRWASSNFGAASVRLAAPGAGVLSTVPTFRNSTGYAFFNGTSMAAPHVSGAAALALSLAPDAPYALIRDAILAGVDRLPALDGLVATGGRLNAARTLRALQGTGEPPALSPFRAVEPLGSLVFEAAAGGFIGAIGTPADRIPLAVQPGQTITIEVSARGGLRPIVELALADGFGNFRVVSEAAEAGGVALIQTGPVGGPLTQVGPRSPQARPYVVTIRGLDGTAGGYDLRVVLNAALEEEGRGGPRNDSIASAQPLDASFLAMVGSYEDAAPGLPSRAAVLGRVDAPGVDLGPDGFGYAASAVPFEFEDIRATGSRTLINVDDGFTTLTPAMLGGFAFPFYGATQTTFFPNSNGFLTFGSGTSSFSNTNLAASPSQAAVVPFWDDLVVSGSPAAAVIWEVRGSGADRRLILQWNDVSFFAGAGAGQITFQSVLYADGAMQFNYLDLASNHFGAEGASATVGIKDAGPQGPNRLLVSLDAGPNRFVGSGRSTRIEPAPPAPDDHYAATLRAGQALTLAARALSGGAVRLELLDESGRVAARGLRGEDRIVNGGFESGDFRGWTVEATGSPFQPWQVTGAGAGGGFGMAATQPQEGRFVAWNGFDGAGPMEFRMSQVVTIPEAEAPTLSWRERIQWNFTLGTPATLPRFVEVELRDPSTGALLETVHRFSTGTQAENPTGDTGWQGRAADLSAFAGSTVRIVFREVIPQSQTGPGQAEFDAIRLDAGPTPANLDDLIEFVAPASGTYFIRVGGDPGAEYNLVATRDLAFSLERNDDLASAQPLRVEAADGRRYVLGHVGRADPRTITFDELPPRPANGVNLSGVTFGFTVNGAPSPLATFGGSGPGTTAFTSDPSLEGPTSGVLTLDFDRPTPIVAFGLALSTSAAVAEGASVALLDASGGLLGAFRVAVSPQGFAFSSGQFRYEGAPASRAVIDPNASAAGAFVVDNLTFGGAPDRDAFAVEAEGGRRLELNVLLPAREPGAYRNDLIPVIRLLDGSGNLAALTLGSTANRRITLNYAVPAGAGGRYVIEVSALGATRGEYVLGVGGASSPGGSTSTRGVGLAASGSDRRASPAPPTAIDLALEVLERPRAVPGGRGSAGIAS